MRVVIITRSIVLQQGLCALMESLPGIKSVKATKELSEAYAWIGSHPPNILLLDLALLGNDVSIVLEKFRSIAPDMQRVLLVDQVEEVRWVPQYAEGIFIKGESPSAVATIVTNLLFLNGDKHEHSNPNL